MKQKTVFESLSSMLSATAAGMEETLVEGMSAMATTAKMANNVASTGEVVTARFERVTTLKSQATEMRQMAEMKEEFGEDYAELFED